MSNKTHAVNHRVQDKNISLFNFLKFSDEEWNHYAGNSIAYTNRLCYQYYIQWASQINLEVIDFLGENYRATQNASIVDSIHPDVLNKYAPVIPKEDLIRYQRGTLVLKN